MSLLFDHYSSDEFKEIEEALRRNGPLNSANLSFEEQLICYLHEQFNKKGIRITRLGLSVKQINLLEKNLNLHRTLKGTMTICVAYGKVEIFRYEK